MPKFDVRNLMRAIEGYVDDMSTEKASEYAKAKTFRTVEWSESKAKIEIAFEDDLKVLVTVEHS